MKAKTIKQVLRKKFDDFVASITDEKVRKMVEDNTIITGGAIVSMLMQEKVNDYDLYFRNRETVLAVAQYYLGVFSKNPPITFKGQPDHTVPMYIDDSNPERVKIVIKSAGIASDKGADNYSYFEAGGDEHAEAYVNAVTNADEVGASTINDEKPKYTPVFLSSNAITLSNGVQLVLRFFGEPEEIHKNYDFIHCTSVWTSWDNKLVLPQPALEAILTKELRYTGSRYPLCSIIRIRKFVARGWSINAGQILKMCMQLNELKLTDIAVLEDQLTGVDAAYFVQVLDRLRAKQKEDGTEGQPVDSTYLMTIIDRLF
jgi:hypothetical protein